MGDVDEFKENCYEGGGEFVNPADGQAICEIGRDTRVTMQPNGDLTLKTGSKMLTGGHSWVSEGTFHMSVRSGKNLPHDANGFHDAQVSAHRDGSVTLEDERTWEL